MRDDAVYLACPRWLEESGLPEQLTRELGPGAWCLFKKLAELEVEQNLLPDWFTGELADLARWTGLEETTLRQLLDRLLEKGYLQQKRTASLGKFRLRFAVPLPVPRSKEEIAGRFAERGWSAKSQRWRYLQPGRPRKEDEKVLELYEQLFGARMNDRIADSLAELAQLFEYGEIEEAFQEAKKSGVKHLNWIVRRLYGEADHERIPKTRRRTRSATDSSRPATDG